MRLALVLIPGALLAAFPAASQVDANPNKILMEMGSGNTVTDIVRTTKKTRNVTITRNPQDELTITYPTVMSSGLTVDVSNLPAFAPGSSVIQVRPTAEIAPSSDSGAFRTTCAVKGLAKDDPIVYPGQPGRSHAHTFFSNALTDAFSDATSLMATGNGTCRGGFANGSAYWVPAMIDIRNSVPIFPTGMLAYYKTGRWLQNKGYGWAGADGVWHPVTVLDPATGQQVPKFPGFSFLPTGLRFVMGDPMNTTPSGGAYRWNCNGVFSNQIPAACGVGTLVQELFGPQCWDGINLDSPDHKSHLSYAIGVRNAGDSRGWSHPECPATHPKVLPEISFQITFSVLTANAPANWRLVSDMNLAAPAGVSSHGDVFVAWRKDPADPTGVRTFADVFVENCVKKNKDCHAHLLGDGREIY